VFGALAGDSPLALRGLVRAGDVAMVFPLDAISGSDLVGKSL
jgi:hypothetical protein